MNLIADKKFNQVKTTVNNYMHEAPSLLVNNKCMDTIMKSFEQINKFKSKQDIINSLANEDLLDSLDRVCKLYSEIYSKNSKMCADQYNQVKKRIKDFNACLKKCSEDTKIEHWKSSDLSESCKSEMFTAAHRLFNEVQRFKECLESVDETNSVLSNTQTSATKESDVKASVASRLVKKIKKYGSKVKKLIFKTRSKPKSNLEEPLNLKDNCLEYLSVVLQVLDFEKRRFTIKLGKVEDNEFIYTTKEEFEFLENCERCIAKLWKTDWQPQLSDIKQVDIGDCYLLAALQTIVQTNPQAIKDVFVKYDKKKNTVTLSFYKVDITSNRTENKLVAKQNGKIKIKVNASIMNFGNSGVIKNDSAIWVNLIEKAYVIYQREGITCCKRTDSSESSSSKYDVANIDGGLSIIPMTAITGKKSELTFQKQKNESTLTEAAASKQSGSVGKNSQGSTAALSKTAIDNFESFEIFKKALDAKKVVAVGTKPETDPVWKNKYAFRVIDGLTTGNKPCNGKSIIYGNHAHSVKRIIDDKHIILLNPHMDKSYKITNISKQDEYGKNILRARKIITKKGELHMDLEIFKIFFSRYHIGKTKSSKSVT